MTAHLSPLLLRRSAPGQRLSKPLGRWAWTWAGPGDLDVSGAGGPGRGRSQGPGCGRSQGPRRGRGRGAWTWRGRGTWMWAGPWVLHVGGAGGQVTACLLGCLSTPAGDLQCQDPVRTVVQAEVRPPFRAVSFPGLDSHWWSDGQRPAVGCLGAPPLALACGIACAAQSHLRPSDSQKDNGTISRTKRDTGRADTNSSCEGLADGRPHVQPRSGASEAPWPPRGPFPSSTPLL